MKLQHWSYRICSRIGHSPFLKESCRVLSYKSKIDLTGAHGRWILKMKVRSTFFHRFSAFSHICSFFPIFAVTSSCLLLLLFEYSTLKVLGVDLQGVQTCRLSAPLRRRRIFVLLSSTWALAMWSCEFDCWIILDRIGSCWRQVTFSWQFGFRKSINAVLHPFCISACSSLSFWEKAYSVWDHSGILLTIAWDKMSEAT